MAEALARAAFRDLLNLVRKHRDAITAQPDGPLGFCMALLSKEQQDSLVTEARRLLAQLSPDMQDYAISSSYTRLIGNERRKALSAYFRRSPWRHWRRSKNLSIRSRHCA